jgi:hypothetical protein
MTRPDGPFVAKLPREPGRRESRYMQLFSGEAPPEVGDETHAAMPDRGTGRPDLAGRVAALEAEVADLRREIEALRTRA